ncbi:MAG: hypothetical protein CG440_804 [Methanosaeta sp. NSM2]|nr:MAG: hypothetical protein CG440_804 [Methanosaeta sp. NSM2]
MHSLSPIISNGLTGVNFESRLYRFNNKPVYAMIETGNAGGKEQLAAVLLLLFLVPNLLPPAHAADSYPDASGQSLTINVYLDSSGKALVTGYAESIDGLDFLNGSQFRLENDSHQLYALTAGLTAKEGDLWTLRFDATGDYNDYRVTFYLPNQTSLGEINISQGLGYLLSASNESLVADVQGWEVTNPRISIEYRQPLASNGISQLPLPPGYPGQGTALMVLIIAAALMIAGFGFAVLLQRKRRGQQEPPPLAAIKPAQEAERAEEIPFARAEEVAAAQSEDSSGRVTLASGPSAAQSPSMPHISAQPDPSAKDDAAPLKNEEASLGAIEPDPYVPRAPVLAQTSDSSQRPGSGEFAALSSSPLPQEASSDEDATARSSSHKESEDKSLEKEVVVSSEMEAVMQTLTARERAVMSTLIAHGGRMTQAEIRYETATPKSSLTGILISLERRKLIIKKEWGRTNIIELSEWFLSKKEPS